MDEKESDGAEVRVPTDDSRWPASQCVLAALDLDFTRGYQRCGSLTFGTFDGQASSRSHAGSPVAASDLDIASGFAAKIDKVPETYEDMFKMHQL